MMTGEFKILSVDHYSMDGSSGCSVRVLSDTPVHKSNNFGIEVGKANVPYEELDKLKSFADKLPAVFKAKMSITNVKTRSGAEQAALNLADLQYVRKLEIK